MKEAIFCTEVIASLKAAGCWAYKIPDTPASAYKVGAMRFVAKKPFDIVACRSRLPIAIECKQYRKGFKGFGLNQLEDHQIEALNDFWEKGGATFVFLNIRLNPIKGERKRENRLLIFEWPMRFYSKAEIEAYPYIEGSKGAFSLSEWLAQVEEQEAVISSICKIQEAQPC